MSTSAQIIINRALRLLGVVDPQEVPGETQAANALEALNVMVHGWVAQGVDVGHDDWTLTDDIELEIGKQHIGALAALLAIELQPEYPGSVLSPVAGGMAANGWNALLAAFMDTSIDSDLRVDRAFLPRRRTGFVL